MITRLGVFSVGGLAPAIAGYVSATLTKLRAQLAGALRLSGLISVTPPTVATQVTLATRLLAQVTAAAAVGVTPPRVNLTGNASAVAALQAQVAAAAQISAALTTGGASLEVYRYEGPAAQFGYEVSTETAGGVTGGAPSDQVFALVIVTRSSAAFAALGEIIRT